jgi:hypothetical protein
MTASYHPTLPFMLHPSTDKYEECNRCVVIERRMSIILYFAKSILTPKENKIVLNITIPLWMFLEIFQKQVRLFFYNVQANLVCRTR